MFCFSGGQSCWGLCSAVYELHECDLCCSKTCEISFLLSPVIISLSWWSSFLIVLFPLFQNILIDACVLDSDSGLLQQVSVFFCTVTLPLISSSRPLAPIYPIYPIDPLTPYLTNESFHWLYVLYCMYTHMTPENVDVVCTSIFLLLIAVSLNCLLHNDIYQYRHWCRML